MNPNSSGTTDPTNPYGIGGFSDPQVQAAAQFDYGRGLSHHGGAAYAPQQGGVGVGGLEFLSNEAEVRRALDRYSVLQGVPYQQQEPYLPPPPPLPQVGGVHHEDGGTMMTSVAAAAAAASTGNHYAMPTSPPTWKPGDSRAVKRAKRNEWDRERRKSETEEEREARLERRRMIQWKKLNEEPYDKIQQKKDRRNALERERRKSETPEERLERLARRKDYERKRRSQDSSDDGTGGGSASAGRATRSRRTNNKGKTAVAENPLNPLDFALQQQRLQFLAPPTSQHQQQLYVPSAITTGAQAGMSGAGGSGSIDSNSGKAQHLDQRAMRNEAERIRRMHETDEERARRRAKRNEIDRRRYKRRKESGGGGSSISSSGGGGDRGGGGEQFLGGMIGGDGGDQVHHLQMMPPVLGQGADEEAILDSVGQVFHV